MSRLNMRLIRLTLLTVAVSLFALGSASATRKGNIWYEVNYNAVLDGQVRICDQSLNMPDDVLGWTVQQWNEAVGKNILVLDCTGIPGLTVLDQPAGFCGQYQEGTNCQGGVNIPLCADWVTQEAPMQLTMSVTPDYSGCGQPAQQTMAVHDMGHELGFAHWPYTGSCVSIMHYHDCIYILPAAEPQQVDIDNYGTAYYVDPPTALAGSSTSPNTVVLSWNPGDIHNEALFYIQKAPGGTENWAWIDTAGQDEGGKTLTGQDAGPWRYRVGGWTGAWCIPYGGFCAAGTPVTVQVQGSLPDLIVTAAPATVTKNENAQATFNITVKNQGTSAAGPFAVALKFDGQYRPDLQGICAFNNGLGAGVTQQCTTTSVTMNFPGGDMQAVADWAGQVTETNESNNTLNGGRLKVTPKTPNEDATHNDIVTWPSGGWYAFVDRSGIETGFDVRIRRASSSCSSWTTVTTKSHGSKSGTGQQTVGTYNFAHGYCWKIEVKVKGLYADSSWKSEYAPVWYP